MSDNGLANGVITIGRQWEEPKEDEVVRPPFVYGFSGKGQLIKLKVTEIWLNVASMLVVSCCLWSASS